MTTFNMSILQDNFEKKTLCMFIEMLDNLHTVVNMGIDRWGMKGMRPPTFQPEGAYSIGNVHRFSIQKITFTCM